MAIDSAQKRFSMMDMDLPTQPGMVPPTGSDTVGKRLSLLWLYSGVAPGIPSTNGTLAAALNGITSAFVGTFGPNGVIAGALNGITAAFAGSGGSSDTHDPGYDNRRGLGGKRKPKRASAEWWRELAEDRAELAARLREIANPQTVEEVAEIKAASPAVVSEIIVPPTRSELEPVRQALARLDRAIEVHATARAEKAKAATERELAVLEDDDNEAEEMAVIALLMRH